MGRSIEGITLYCDNVDTYLAPSSEDQDLELQLNTVCPESLVQAVVGNIEVEKTLAEYNCDDEVIEYLKERGYFVYEEDRFEKEDE